MDKVVLGLELKPSDAMDRSRWKAKIKGYWCDSNSRGNKRWL